MDNNLSKSLVLFILFLCFISTSDAGIFSAVGKAAKAAKKVDIDAPSLKLDVDLPKHFPDHTPVKLFESPTGEWHIKLPDGNFTSLRALAALPKKQRHALIIDRYDLPQDLSKFDAIPDDYPVFIKYRHNQLFAFKTGASKSIAYQNVVIDVKNIKELQRAMWHLHRPIMSKGTHWLYLDKDPNKTLPPTILNGRSTVDSVGSQHVLDMMRQSRLQTVVIAGEIQKSKLLIPDSKNVIEIAALSRAAERYDVSLIILDTPKPVVTLKTSIKDFTNLSSASSAQLLSTIAKPTVDNPLKLSINANERSQIAIQSRPRLSETVQTQSGSIDMPLSIHLFKPTQERDEELDDRLIPYVHSNISWYLLFSALLGFVFMGISWRYWNTLWQVKQSSEYSNILIYLFLRIIHFSIFVIIYLPVLGLPSLLLYIVLWILGALNFLLIKPIRWLFSKLIPKHSS